MNKIDKNKDHAFGKDIYLLGQDKEGYNVYLEAPRWKCGWYWGFGYIERYTRKTNPSTSADIKSHSHWNYSIVGKQEIYNSKLERWEETEYIHHINDNPDFVSTVLTDRESWELSELMERFYILKKSAELFHKGSAGITTIKNDTSLEKKVLYDYINKLLLSRLFKQLDKLLTPDKEDKKDLT